MADVMDIGFDIETLAACYRRGVVTPRTVVKIAYRRIQAHADNPIWISLRDEQEALRHAEALQAHAADAETLPLYGLPFAVKDNIDVAGLPTTAGCPAFSYHPTVSAPVVRRLEEAGAIFIGKTNLDQFATGLTGTRSPYGVCRNAFNPGYIAGGSSSGSALAVALGQVSFALGTDTAGSGRVPAAFNNIVGLKPTRGLIGTTGVVPACRSLDCVSVFALTSTDAQRVFQIAQAPDDGDPFARALRVQQRKSRVQFRFGVPQRTQWEFFGDTQAPALFEQSIERLRAIGGVPVTIDFAPFHAAGRLLYEGPWVAERYAALKDFLARHTHELHPVTRAVLNDADRHSASAAFQGLYELKAFEQSARAAWRAMDLLLLPSAGTIPTLAQVLQEPITLNTALGYYTNFVNLMDLCAIALPAGFRSDGLPFGITLIAPALHDDWLCSLGAAYHQQLGGSLGATCHGLPSATFSAAAADASEVLLAVAGAHLTGLPLNHQLVQRGARLLRTCRAASHYKLYALPGTQPPKPGLIFSEAPQAHAIDVEVWAVPLESFGALVAEVPPPLAIGTLILEDGERVKGFVCEGHAVQHAEDISRFGGWRQYLAARNISMEKGETV